ncbi:MAG: tetratricopeptide repeat protein [Terriglobales bacterium]
MTAVKRIALWALVSAVLLGLAPGQSSSQRRKGAVKHRVPVEDDRTASLITKAETAIEKRDFATAEPLLREAVQAGPQDFRAWFDLGFVLNATGRSAEAVEAYRKSVAANPKVFESNLNLGVVLAEAKDPEAEKYLRAATQLKPAANVNEGLKRAWLALGRVLEAKNAAGALAAFAEATKLQPNDPDPHLSAGALLEQQNRLFEAEKEYRQAAQLDPKNADAVVGLVNVYQKAGRLAEAEAALRQYLALEPQNAAAHFQLGRVLLKNHKRVEAIAAYEAGLKLTPDDASAQRELAWLYDVGNEHAKAETMYRALLQRNPNDAAARAGLGSALLHLRKPQVALNELLAAVKLDPKLGEAYGDLAIAASQNKNYELTVKALDARAQLLPETPATYFLRATAYDNLHLTKEAAANYRRFLEAADGRFPDQEWQARHRLIAIEPTK